MVDNAQTVWIPITGEAAAFEPRQLADRFRDPLIAELLKQYRKGQLDVSYFPNMQHLHNQWQAQTRRYPDALRALIAFFARSCDE